MHAVIIDISFNFQAPISNVLDVDLQESYLPTIGEKIGVATCTSLDICVCIQNSYHLWIYLREDKR